LILIYIQHEDGLPITKLLLILLLAVCELFVLSNKYFFNIIGTHYLGPILYIFIDDLPKVTIRTNREIRLIVPLYDTE
jgi:hypothetical protein